MGADDQSEAKPKTFAWSEHSLDVAVREKLLDGWYLAEDSDGQILLVPPPHYGDPRD